MCSDKISLTPLQESLLILQASINHIGLALKVITPDDRIRDEDLKFTICNYILIRLCAFLEEWSKLESLGSDKKVQFSLKIASPAIDRIRQWTGLTKVRSLLLAHGSRDKQGIAHWPADVFAQFDAPTAYAEIILLGNCAILAAKSVINGHNEEFQKGVKELKDLQRPIKDKGIRTVEEIKEELNKIKAKMLEIAEDSLKDEKVKYV